MNNTNAPRSITEPLIAQSRAGEAGANLTDVLASMVVLENHNGVQIREDIKFQGHYGAANALCECGEELIVAPKIFGADHKKGDPVMVCGDHGVHGYRFSSLVKGQQPTGSAQ